MADQQPGLYMIAYDIANPRRLVRIHRYLKKQGLPLQYSVFTLVIKRKALLKLLQGLDSIMCKREDDIRCYRLSVNVIAETLGRQMFPEDVMFCLAKG